jgi:hypothetical protein
MNGFGLNKTKENTNKRAELNRLELCQGIWEYKLCVFKENTKLKTFYKAGDIFLGANEQYPKLYWLRKWNRPKCCRNKSNFWSLFNKQKYLPQRPSKELIDNNPDWMYGETFYSRHTAQTRRSFTWDINIQQ